MAMVYIMYELPYVMQAHTCVFALILIDCSHGANEKHDKSLEALYLTLCHSEDLNTSHCACFTIIFHFTLLARVWMRAAES